MPTHEVGAVAIMAAGVGGHTHRDSSHPPSPPQQVSLGGPIVCGAGVIFRSRRDAVGPVQPVERARSVAPRSVTAMAPIRTRVRGSRRKTVESTTVTTMEAFEDAAATETGRRCSPKK
jgi:hypothetical protein